MQYMCAVLYMCMNIHMPYMQIRICIYVHVLECIWKQVCRIAFLFIVQLQYLKMKFYLHSALYFSVVHPTANHITHMQACKERYQSERDVQTVLHGLSQLGCWFGALPGSRLATSCCRLLQRPSRYIYLLYNTIYNLLIYLVA